MHSFFSAAKSPGLGLKTHSKHRPEAMQIATIFNKTTKVTQNYYNTNTKVTQN